jgi:phosphoglycolate phosphatase-like HAD superfamily hydrolase
MTAVLLWDIDGTLLTTGRAGIFAWQGAARELVGPDVDVVTMHTAGKTDVEIAAEILATHGRDAAPARVDALVRRYEALLPECLPLRPGRVLPGVREVLDALRGRDRVLSLLLTGNTRAGARAKLTHFGLAEYFDGGAFADDARDRVGVARCAAALVAGQLAERAAGATLYVVGDTPADIRCGDAIGARTVAVATGEYGEAELARHRPWLVLPALPPPDAFFDRLGLAAATAATLSRSA